MKLFFLILILSTNLYSLDKNKLNSTIKDAAQKIITEKGFSLIKEENIIKAQEKVTTECIDNSCLMDTGKILAAKRLFKLEVKKVKENKFLIQFEDIDVEKRKTLKTVEVVFNDKLDNYKAIFNVIEELINKNIKKIDKKEIALLEIILPDIKVSEKDKVDRFMTAGKKKRWEKTLRKVTKTLRSAAEQTITNKNFTILDQSIQEEALAGQTESGCLDDSCLMDTGKMLAASRIFIVKISPLGKNQYLFKITHTNLETNEMVKSQSEIYTEKLDDYNKLLEFGQKFFKTIFQDEEIQTGKKIPIMLQILVDNKKVEDDDGVETFLLKITTPYDPVNVYHGGESFGITPLTVKVPKGTYLLKFKKEGYDDAETRYELKKDSKLSFTEIYTKGGPYPITFKTKLPSTFRYKKEVGKTPKTIYLKAGKYKIELENNIAGNKKFDIDVTTAEEFSFKMNRGFNWIILSPNFEFWYQSFSDWNTPYKERYQEDAKSTYMLIGLKARLFVWNWKYFDLDILGGGFSVNAQFDKIYSYQFHLLEFNFKPIESLSFQFNLGPIGGDITRLYYGDKTKEERCSEDNKNCKPDDRIEYAMSLLGGKATYTYRFMQMFSLSTYLGAYFSNHSNFDSLFTNEDKDVIYGWMFNFGIKVDVKF